MKWIFLTSFVLQSLHAFSQDCTVESLLVRAGAWKAATRGAEGGTATDLAKERKIIAAIHTMIKSRYSPRSVEAVFSGMFNPPFPTMPVNSFGYNIIPLNFYCDNSTIKTAHESSTYFSIGVNMLDAEIYDTAQGDRSLAEGFNVISGMPVEKDGSWCFKESNANLGFGITGKSKAWLITYDDKLPFDFVTKKEFLEKRKRSLSAQMLSSATGIKDVLKNIEVEKKYKEEEYRNDPAKLQQYLKTGYLSTKDKYEKLLANNEREYKPAFDKIEAQLSLPAAELNRPAIVRADPGDPLSYLFTDENDPFGKILIKPNPGYFNKKIPRSSPQFFWIYVRGDQHEPIAARFMEEIMKSVDFTVLKNMLGK